MITNIIIGTLIIFSSIAPDNLVWSYCLSCANIYDDIFIATKNNYLLPHTIFTEDNPIANILFKYNLWETGYFLAIGVNAGVVWLIMQSDWSSKKELSDFYLLVINLAELYAVGTSTHPSNGIKYKIECPLFTKTF